MDILLSPKSLYKQSLSSLAGSDVLEPHCAHRDLTSGWILLLTMLYIVIIPLWDRTFFFNRPSVILLNETFELSSIKYDIVL